MTVLAPVSLIAAAITTGLTAGVFALYAHTIMPALQTIEDRTVVTAFTAGDPSRIHDLAVVRERLHFTRWVNWNYVRVATAIGSFACLSWALVLYGRATA